MDTSMGMARVAARALIGHTPRPRRRLWGLAPRPGGLVAGARQVPSTARSGGRVSLTGAPNRRPRIPPSIVDASASRSRKVAVGVSCWTRPQQLDDQCTAARQHQP